KTALSASARGSGKLAATDKPMWWDWFTGGEKNIRIYLRAKDRTELKGHFARRALLSGFELGQEGDNGLVDVSATIDSSGPVEWVSTL
ncbi:hypothetical protein, partial [Neomegalonema sp.]|uniref:hypothetical protein n=1 Tax=Neomegalonema sp. TaxID=2039713 RepID=UPI00262F0BB0